MKQLWWQTLALFRCHKVNVLHGLRCGWQKNEDDFPLRLDQNASFYRAHDLPVVCILAGASQSTVPRSVPPTCLHRQEHKGGRNGSQDRQGSSSWGQLHAGPKGCLGEETCSKASLLRTLFQVCAEGGLKTREEKGANRGWIWKPDFTDKLSRI